MSKSTEPKVSSMTGFATVEGEIPPNLLRIECKTLNHRFLDIKIRLPRDLSRLENLIRSSIQKFFSRGTVEFKMEYVAIDNLDEYEPQPDVKLAQHYKKSLEAVAKATGSSESPTLGHLIQFPDIIKRPGSELKTQTIEELWEQFQPHVERCLKSLREMRDIEGEKLKNSILDTLKSISDANTELTKLRAKSQQLIRDKVERRVTDIFEKYPLPDSASNDEALRTRVAQELSLVLERSDIEEELTRLAHHTEQLQKLLNTMSSPIGRKLEFLLQESHREINTLGNKAQDLGVSDIVVDMKVKLEQIREQSMNIE